MSLQRRPLTGMVIANGSTPPAIAPRAPLAAAVIHQIDATSPANFLDQVTLFARNVDNAAQTLNVVVMGVTISVVIPGVSAVQIFDGQPFFGVPGNPGASQITIVNVTAADDIEVWGYFTR